MQCGGRAPETPHIVRVRNYLLLVHPELCVRAFLWKPERTCAAQRGSCMCDCRQCLWVAGSRTQGTATVNATATWPLAIIFQYQTSGQLTAAHPTHAARVCRRGGRVSHLAQWTILRTRSASAVCGVPGGGGTQDHVTATHTSTSLGGLDFALDTLVRVLPERALRIHARAHRPTFCCYKHVRIARARVIAYECASAGVRVCVCVCVRM